MGTTNTRAWLVREGAVAARAGAPVGIRDAAVAGSADLLRSTVLTLVGELTRDAARELPPLVAAGMITSAQGLEEVPHLPAPAGVRELAGGVRRHPLGGPDDPDLLLIPGVRTGPARVDAAAIGTTDVMRGEETLFVGLQAAGLLREGETLLNLGSHWKMVWADGSGRVAGSRTFLTGELMHVAQSRTVLAASVPQGRPEGLDPAWVRLGAVEAGTSGLDRALFCVRLLQQRCEATASERHAYLVGAFLGGVLPHLLALVVAGSAVAVAGGAAVAGIVADALRADGRAVRVLEEEQVEAGMVRGLGAVLAAALGTPD